MILSKNGGEVRAISGSSGTADGSVPPFPVLKLSLTCPEP